MSDLQPDTSLGFGQIARGFVPQSFQGSGQEGEGRGYGLGTLWEGVKTAATDVLNFSPLGDAASLIGGLSPVEGLSPLERGLMLAGAVGVGAAAGRQAVRAIDARYRPQVPVMQAPRPAQWARTGTGAQELVELGLKMPMRKTWSEMAQGLSRAYPGVRTKSLEILAGEDPASVARALYPEAKPEVQAVHAGTVEALGQRFAEAYPDATDPTGLAAAKLALAQLDYADERGLFGASTATAQSRPGEYSTKRFVELFTSFKADPQALLKSGEIEELVDYLFRFGSAFSRIPDPDLQFDPVARVSAIDFASDGTPVAWFDRPVWAAEDVFSSERVTVGTSTMSLGQNSREARLKRLNYRALYTDGTAHIRYLLDIADQDAAARAVSGGRSGVLPAPNELGAKWYPEARRFTDEALKNDLLPTVQSQYGPDAWSPDLPRAVAAVSITSAAQDWKKNIEVAVRSLARASDPRVAEEGFQAWLRADPKARTSMPEHARFQALADELFEDLRRSENRPGDEGTAVKLSKRDFEKVLRLRAETPEQVFSSTTSPSPKQKNFYLNILRPELDVPITVDRHAFDIFNGVDSGVDDRPVELGLDEENVYELISEAYREVARERGMLPHEVQAVAWETWKQLKDDWRLRKAAEFGQLSMSGNVRPGFSTWNTANDPFRLELDGKPNRAYRALQGFDDGGISKILQSMPTDRSPVVLGIPPLAKKTGRMAFFNAPDGTVAVYGDVTPEVAAQARNLYPAFTQDGVARWVPGFVRRVRDVSRMADEWAGDLGEWQVDSFDNAVLAGGKYWGLDGGRHLVFDVPRGKEQKILDALARLGVTGQQERIPGAMTMQRQRRVERRGASGLTVRNFTDPSNTPLLKEQWVTISAEINDTQAARFGLEGYDNARRHRQLGEMLRERGYTPIEQRGKYGNDERSYLVRGMPTSEAIELGGRFHQDSVLSPDGLFYTIAAENPANVGKMSPATGEVGFNQDVDDFYSAIVIQGREVKYQLGVDTSQTIEVVDPDSPLREVREVAGRKMHIRLPDGFDVRALPRIIADIKAEGAGRPVFYGHETNVGGLAPVRETAVTDGVRTYVHRSADPDLTAPNGVVAWMHPDDARGLTTKTPTRHVGVQTAEFRQGPMPGQWWVNDEVIVQYAGGEPAVVGRNPFDTKIDGVRPKFFSVTITPDGFPLLEVGVEPIQPMPGAVAVSGQFGARIKLDQTDNATAAAMAVDTLRRVGVDVGDVDLSTGTGFLKLSRADGQGVPKAGNPTDYLGRALPRVFSDVGPNDVGAATYLGIGKVRMGRWGNPTSNKLVVDAFRELEDLYGGLAEFEPKELVALKRTGDSTAYVEWTANGRIVFSKAWLDDPDGYVTALVDEGTYGDWARDVGGKHTPVHEYGHVLHKNLELRSKRQYRALNKKLRALLKANKDDIAENISTYAATDLWELVAESFTMVHTTSTPHPIARQVVDSLLDSLDKTSKIRKVY